MISKKFVKNIKNNRYLYRFETYLKSSSTKIGSLLECLLSSDYIRELHYFFNKYVCRLFRPPRKNMADLKAVENKFRPRSEKKIFKVIMNAFWHI